MSADGDRKAGPGRRQGAGLDRTALAALPTHPGLCATCTHLELLGSKRSVFVRCALSDDDSRFPRYPALPVHRCEGYEEEA